VTIRTIKTYTKKGRPFIMRYMLNCLKLQLRFLSGTLLMQRCTVRIEFLRTTGVRNYCGG